jgi:hypothetical protein
MEILIDLQNHSFRHLIRKIIQMEKLSILPKPQDNIYPSSRDNIDSLLNFYFNKNGLYFEGGDLSFLYSNPQGLQLNQLEFIAKKVSENISFFKKELNYNGLTIRNLMQYGIDAFFEDFNKFDVSVNRNRLTISFFELLVKDKA